MVLLVCGPGVLIADSAYEQVRSERVASLKALAQQANFLKEQGRLQAVVPDYSKSVSTQWVTEAMK